MAADEGWGEAELFSDVPHFVFVKIFQRFDYQALFDERLNSFDAVMVRFDDLRIFRAARFDDVGVERALREHP